VKTAAFLVVAAALALGAGASSQDEVNPLSIKFGLYWPSAHELKDLGDTWFYGELDYGFARNYDTNSAWHVHLGYTQQEGRTMVGEDETDVDVTIIPVTFGMRYDQPPDDMAAGSWYFGWGVGAYFVNWDIGVEDDNEVQLGGHLYAGYDWGDGFFIEGKYRVMSDFGSEDVTLSGNGLTAMIGFKLVK
jgi:hypothetical protein